MLGRAARLAFEDLGDREQAFVWIGDAIIGAKFKSEADSLTQEWASAPATPAPTPDADPDAEVRAPDPAMWR